MAEKNATVRALFKQKIMDRLPGLSERSAQTMVDMMPQEVLDQQEFTIVVPGTGERIFIDVKGAGASQEASSSSDATEDRKTSAVKAAMKQQMIAGGMSAANAQRLVDTMPQALIDMQCNF